MDSAAVCMVVDGSNLATDTALLWVDADMNTERSEEDMSRIAASRIAVSRTAEVVGRIEADSVLVRMNTTGGVHGSDARTGRCQDNDRR